MCNLNAVYKKDKKKKKHFNTTKLAAKLDSFGLVNNVSQFQL